MGPLIGLNSITNASNNQSQAAENAHALYMRYKNTHLGFLKEMLR